MWFEEFEKRRQLMLDTGLIYPGFWYPLQVSWEWKNYFGVPQMIWTVTTLEPIWLPEMKMRLCKHYKKSIEKMFVSMEFLPYLQFYQGLTLCWEIVQPLPVDQILFDYYIPLLHCFAPAPYIGSRIINAKNLPIHLSLYIHMYVVRVKEVEKTVRQCWIPLAGMDVVEIICYYLEVECLEDIIMEIYTKPRTTLMANRVAQAV